MINKQMFILIAFSVIFPISHANAQFIVQGKNFKTAEEAQAYAISLRNSQTKLFTPEMLIVSGISRSGGNAVYVIPTTDFIETNFVKNQSLKKIFGKINATDSQNKAYARSISDQILSFRDVIQNLKFFDSIKTDFHPNPNNINLDYYKDYDFIIYVTAGQVLGDEGIFKQNSKTFHGYQNRNIVYNVYNRNSNSSYTLSQAVGNSSAFATYGPEDLFKRLSSFTGGSKIINPISTENAQSIESLHPTMNNVEQKEPQITTSASEDIVLDKAIFRCEKIGFKRETAEFRSCVTEQIKLLSN